MVDSSKRNSLKAFGAMIASPLVPASLLSTASYASEINGDVRIDNVGGNEELSISINLHGTPTMQVTNNSNSLTILRRINPNTVLANGKTYDLNHSLYSNAHALSAGETRTFPIAETNSAKANPQFAAQYPRKQLRLATVTADRNEGLALNTSKVFFS